MRPNTLLVYGNCLGTVLRSCVRMAQNGADHGVTHLHRSNRSRNAAANRDRVELQRHAALQLLARLTIQFLDIYA